MVTPSPETRCLTLSESEVKRGSYVMPKYSLCNRSKDESLTEVVFGKKKKKVNSRDNYLCVIITLSPKQEKKKKKKPLMGKLNEKQQQQKKWRSKNAHDRGTLEQDQVTNIVCYC